MKKRISAWGVGKALLIWLWIVAGMAMGSILGLYGLDGSIPHRLVGLTLLLLLASAAFDLAGGLVRVGKSLFVAGIVFYFAVVLVTVVGIIAIRLTFGG